MRNILFGLITTSLLTVGCGNEQKQPDDMNSESEAYSNQPHSATVVDKIDANSYTYLQVSENDEVFWIAVPRMEIQSGEKIFFSKSMEMTNFKSETINKTFESILFVEDASKSDHSSELKNPHSTLSTVPKEDIKVEPVTGSKTIKEIFSDIENLSGKMIKVKGKVVKYNHQIMNRNWIHIQDGTSAGNDFDLVVTSDDQAKVGDVIVAEGTLSKDKDFGSGYVFKVIIENAKISKGI